VIRHPMKMLCATFLLATLLPAGLALEGQPAKVEAVLLNGEKVNLDRWKGKVVMVNFWATWCAVCQTEMPGW